MSSRAEAADVALVVDVARRRADEHELAERARARAAAASTPIIALTECPTKIASRSSSSSADLDDVVGVAVERARSAPGRTRARSEPPAPTWSKSTTRWSASNAGATKRHMFWSQPKPCAKTIGRPSGPPGDRDVVALEHAHAPSLGRGAA